VSDSPQSYHARYERVSVGRPVVEVVR